MLKLILFLFVITKDALPYGPERCVFKGCHPIDKNKINVHLIPHSHDDVGWLKTVGEYYKGMKNDIQNVGVQYILTAVLESLVRDKTKRYIQVETAFFWQWWQEQTEEKRQLFRSCVQNGQIEMVGGGWSMSDEACTNYQSTIDQLTWGLRLLNDTLGECAMPKIGWQIDPFGHSREQASIFKQLGYDAIFFVRMSAEKKQEMKEKKRLQFLWKSSDSIHDSEIFTHVFSTDSYFAPNGFCWDYLQCKSDFINDDPESFDYNLPIKMQQFNAHIEEHHGYYNNNQVMFGMGGDFQYQAAELNFLNIDALIEAYKNHHKYNVFYSTPSCYYKAVMEDNPKFETETGDFFPYNEDSNVYWTGYFTSRPTLKRFERIGNNILQGVKQLNAHAKMRALLSGNPYEENIRPLREIMATMQHHDAITGTEKQAVANDYVRMLTAAIEHAETPLGYILGELLKKNPKEFVHLPISFCLLTNMTICDNSLKDKFMVVLYNPLSKDVTHHVRLPAQKAKYKVTDSEGDLKYDLVLPMKYHVKTVLKPAEAEIIFALKMPKMGARVVYIEKVGEANLTYGKLQANDSRMFGDAKVNFTLGTNNLLETVSMHNETLDISQKFMLYVSRYNTGAYVFAPANGASAFNINYNKFTGKNGSTVNPTVTYFRGTLVDEVVQKYNDWVSQTIRVYKGSAANYIEFDWMVGPLKGGIEVISRFFVKDFENDYFYTDSNGREMIRRQRNGNEYGLSYVEAVTSNYYPITSKIQIKDEERKLQVSVLTDRSQGGSSLWNGEIELMVHRRLNSDDSKGVEEILQEMEFGNYLVARGQHYLTLGSSNNRDVPINERQLGLQKLLQPLVLIGDASSPEWSLINTQMKLNFNWSALNDYPYPKRTHILSFEPWKDKSYLIRVENFFTIDEFNDNIETNSLYDVFKAAKMKHLRETQLGGNEWFPVLDNVANIEFSAGPMAIITVIVEFEDSQDFLV